MPSSMLVLPGDYIAPSTIPQESNKALVLGPGLRPSPPSSVKASIAGTLAVDARKNAIWVDQNGGRYIPRLNDLVIATVHHSSADLYNCSITPHAPLATLPQLAFEGATKKTRPKLDPGALVYARVSAAHKDLDTELSCVSASSGKAEGLGPLKGGMLFDISAGFARRLLMPESKMTKPAAEGGGAIIVLKLLAEKVGFETAVGRNGKLWVDGGNVKTTLAVGHALAETDDKSLGFEQQKRLVARLLRDLGK